MAIRKIKRKKGITFQAICWFQGRPHTKVFATLTEAKVWEVVERQRLTTITDTSPALMFSAMCADYLTECKARFTPNTVREKYLHLTEFATHLGADIEAQGVTVAKAKAFILSIQKVHGNKSANRRLRTLKACWNAFKEEIEKNPWRIVKPYPEDEYVKYVPPPDDVAAVLDRAALWERRFLHLLVLTGARQGEILQLTWEDVNFERRTLSLWTRKRQGGSRQERKMPFTPTLERLSEELRDEGQGKEGGYVMINPLTSGPYRRLQPSIRYMLKRLCKAAEVKEFGFHALRHFFASRLLASGEVNIVEIQAALGHQRLTTTDTYLRSMSSSIAHLAGVIEGAVLPVASIKEEDHEA